MTHRETVIAALSHQATDPIPYQISLTGQAYTRLAQATGDPYIYEKLGGYLHGGSHGQITALPDRPEHFQDEFGVVWNRSGADKDIGVVDHPLIEDIETSAYRFPPVNAALLRQDAQRCVDDKGDRFAVFGLGFCMFERSWSLMGMENVLMSMIAAPEALEAFYDRICDYHLQLLDILLEYDIDAVQFGDDWGQQKGLIMGPHHWRRFIKPRMARLYDRVKRAGKYVIQHSCGDCREIFPDLVEIGLDCYQTFQPEIYDIVEMKRLFGDKVTFWGGISTQRCLPYMTPAEVQQEIVRVATVLRPNGGLILAPTHAVPGDVPPENILAMNEVFHNQDRFFR